MRATNAKVEAMSGKNTGRTATREKTLVSHRELIDGVYYTVHSSADGRVRINTGPDDQRPEHDGLKFFTPTCVEHMIGTSVYRYLFYCGRCGRRMDHMGQVCEYCPRCGAGVAHTFSMGVARWPGTDQPGMSFQSPPEAWPPEAPAARTEPAPQNEPSREER